MRGERGQVTIVGLGVLGAAIALAIVLIVIGRAYTRYAELQQAADIAATSLARSGSDHPLARARALAAANGADHVTVDVSTGTVTATATFGDPILGGRGHITIEARARIPAEAELTGPYAGAAAGTAYRGPLVAVDGAVSCPRVAVQYREMQRAAALSGIRLWAVSGWRSVEEQAALYARLGPRIAAAPGRSLHHAGTEFDLAVGTTSGGTYQWLAMNASQFGFVQRYSWEPWHWGNVRGC